MVFSSVFFFHLAGLWHSLHLLQLLFFRDFYQLVSHRIFLKHALLAHRHVLLANVFLGLFTKGGRGYCLFICPVGTYNSLFHIFGRFVPGAFAMQVRKNACIGCTKCAQNCPMRAINMHERQATIDRRLCIICGKCAHGCPKQAICYQSNLAKEKE